MYSEEDFVLMVLARAKKIFSGSRSSTYFSETRLNKLACYVADKMNFDLTRGWYKYGIFSITAQEIIPKNVNLNSLELNADQIKGTYTEFREPDIYKIDSSIKALRDKFIKEKHVFYDQLYTFDAPPEYRDLYRSNIKAVSNFKYFLNILGKENIDKILNQAKEIKKYFFSVQKGMSFIERDEVWDNFIDYLDLLKMLFLKLERLGYDDRFAEFRSIFTLYIRSESVEDEIYDILDIEMGDIWTTLVPYSQTLTGRLREQEIRRHEKKLEYLIPHIAKQIDRLTDHSDEIGLLPSVDEIREKIAVIDKKERRPVGEIFSMGR